MTQKSRGRRQGNVFPVRLRPEDRARFELECAADQGPRKLGPWIVWRVLQSLGGITRAQVLPARASPALVLPVQGGHYPALSPRLGNTAPAGQYPPTPIAERLILDLCSGSGSWSEPYKQAGYPVRRVTLPATDVRTFSLPDLRVWGILCAPPCTEFSLAKNGQPRDFRAGLETVSACLRLCLTAAPVWWALENPVGLLGRFLGRPRDVWEPYDFGDPWSKRTALWGAFALPVRGPRTVPIDGGGPLCGVCHPDDPRVCSLAEHRAVTPPGFARAFFEANP